MCPIFEEAICLWFCSVLGQGSGVKKEGFFFVALLEVKDLSVELAASQGRRRLVDGVSLSIQPGEVFCLIGESGCGKSVTALALTRLLPSPPFFYAGGRVIVAGEDVLGMSEREIRRIRGGKVSYIFQDPGAYLNPIHRVGRQIREALALHRPEKANKRRVEELLRLVGIPSPEVRMRDYPHQMSGGMLQRVMIAMALASEPRLLVADEPTTALDATVQAQILRLLASLRERLGMAILLISHDLALVEDFADRVAVMYAGQVVECGTASDVLNDPKHPYTEALLQAAPRIGGGGLIPIPGQAPAVDAFPSGCRFYPRCSLARETCSQLPPPLASVGEDRLVRCLVRGLP